MTALIKETRSVRSCVLREMAPTYDITTAVVLANSPVIVLHMHTGPVRVCAAVVDAAALRAGISAAQNACGGRRGGLFYQLVGADARLVIMRVACGVQRPGME